MVTDTIRHLREETDLSSYNSSNVKYSIYSQKTQMLQVIFSDGSAYVYSEVPMKTYSQFKTAKSQGKALNELIKHKFPYVKMEKHNIVLISMQMEKLFEDYATDNELFLHELSTNQQNEEK